MNENSSVRWGKKEKRTTKKENSPVNKGTRTGLDCFETSRQKMSEELKEQDRDRDR